MTRSQTSSLVALVLSLAVHAGLLAPWPAIHVPTMPAQPLQVSFVDEPVQDKVPLARADQAPPVVLEYLSAGSLAHPGTTRPTPALPRPPRPPGKDAPRVAEPIPPTPAKTPAAMPAPPPPTAEEWKLASTYTLKNSKRYRHNWGQAVRSMMGTAVEGPDQGLVRFRIEIAPDGKIARVEQLWATSELAAKLAWEAIRSMPALPPTPTGKPLVFEQTISFLPYETGWPPSYNLDCLPDPPSFQNPFAWDGSSPQMAAREATEEDSASADAPPPADCVTDSTADSIEAEEAEMKRQMDQWRWGR